MTNSDFEVIFDAEFNYKISELVFYIGYKYCNFSTGKKLIDDLILKAKSLCNFPERHPIMQVEKSTGIEVRKFVVGKYIISYYINKKAKVVHINNLLTSK